MADEKKNKKIPESVAQDAKATVGKAGVQPSQNSSPAPATTGTASQEFKNSDGEHKITVNRSIVQKSDTENSIHSTTTHTINAKKTSTQMTEVSNEYYTSDEYTNVHLDYSNVKKFDGKGRTIETKDTTHQYAVRQTAADIQNGTDPKVVYDNACSTTVINNKDGKAKMVISHSTVDNPREVQRRDLVYTLNKKEEVKTSMMADYSLQKMAVERLDDYKQKSFRAVYDNDGSQNFTYVNKNMRTVYQKDADGKIEGYKMHMKDGTVSKYSELSRKKAEAGMIKARKEADEIVAKVSSAKDVETYKSIPGPMNFAATVSTNAIFRRQTPQQEEQRAADTQVVAQKFKQDSQVALNSIVLKEMQDAQRN